jgi:hypothetical protein
MNQATAGRGLNKYCVMQKNGGSGAGGEYGTVGDG